MTLPLLKRFLIAGLLHDLAHRSGFWSGVLSRIVGMAMFVGTYAVVYRFVQDLSGYTFEESMVYYATFVLMEQMLLFTLGRGMQELPRLIHRGELDYVLVRPADAQLVVAVRSLSVLDAVNLLPPLVLLIVFAHRAGIALSWWYPLLFLVAFAGCAVIVLLLMSLAFWASRVPELSQLVFNIFRMLQFPAGIYEGGMKIFLYGVFPFASMLLLPVDALLDPADLPRMLLQGMLLATALAFLARTVWNIGLRRYASAS